MNADALSLVHAQIRIGGKEASPAIGRACAEIRVSRALSLPTLCEMVFRTDHASIPLSQFSIGKSITVSLADGTVLFEGEISTQELERNTESGRLCRIRAYDRPMRLRRRLHMRSFTQIGLQELLEQLCQDTDLRIRCADTSPNWPYLVQAGQDDLSFLNQCLESHGLYWTCAAGELSVFGLDGIAPAVQLDVAQDAFTYQLEINGAASCRAAQACATHFSTVTSCAVKAESPRRSRHPAGSGEAAAAVSQLVGLIRRNEGNAEHAARADLERQIAREVCFSGWVRGRADLSPGQRMQVKGIPDAPDGELVLTRCVHHLDAAGGYRVELTTCPPRPNIEPAETVFAFGAVTTADDPEAQNRVRVSLPGYGNVVTDWLPVCLPGAGAGKGLLALPDEGDQVIVLLPRSDFAQGVVVGAVFGSQTAPETAVEQGRVKRFCLQSAGGQRILLDDVENTLVLETSGGCRIELNSRGIELRNGAASLIMQGPKISLNDGALEVT